MDSTQTKIKRNATHIDSTIRTIENHLEKKATSGVSASINSWLKKLEEYPELGGISSDLKNLKGAIAVKDGKTIVALMTKLGADTTKAADSTEGSEATKIKHLGKAITAAAKVIAKLL